MSRRSHDFFHPAYHGTSRDTSAHAGHDADSMARPETRSTRFRLRIAARIDLDHAVYIENEDDSASTLCPTADRQILVRRTDSLQDRESIANLTILNTQQ